MGRSAGLAMTSISLFECHTENEFWQLVVAVETTPAFLRAGMRGSCGVSQSEQGAVAAGEGACSRIGGWRLFKKEISLLKWGGHLTEAALRQTMQRPAYCRVYSRGASYE